MITKFKIFENIQEGRSIEDQDQIIPLDEDELASLFSQKFIEGYFDDNYNIDEEEAFYTANLWNYVDIDDVRDGLIKELVNYTDIDDKRFTKADYIYFIENYILNDDKKIKFKWLEDILKDYSKRFNLNIKNIGNKILKYKDILNHMLKEELADVISDIDETDNFLKKYFEEQFGESHPEEILIELHGKHDIKYNSLYPYLKDYIKDKDSIIEDFMYNIEFETKFEFIKDSISNDKNLQNKLIEINPNSIQSLFDCMDHEESKSIGFTYDFQKRYIIFMSENGEHEHQIAECIKNIHDKYGLNSEIEKEYIEYTYLIDSNKYNL